MKEKNFIDYENLGISNSSFKDELEDAAKRVINSGWYILGKEVESFETNFSTYIGSKYCIGVASGLDALILSIEALSLPPRSDVLVASNTYIATIISIIRAGHNPILVEPDKETHNIDPAKLRNALTDKTRLIVVTHLFGKCCRMDEINEFAKQKNLLVIEDCAQAHGAKFNGKKAGNFGITGCFSFYPTKNLGAIGDAGAIVTNNKEIAEKLKYLRNYGSKIKYHNKYLGHNSRLDEIQAAFLKVKLKYLDDMNNHKIKLSKIYFKGLPSWLKLPRINEYEHDVFHIFCVRHPKRDFLKKWLLDNGIRTEIHYPIPPHKQESMKKILTGEWPIADELHNTSLSLPISYGASELQVKRVCEILRSTPFEYK